MVYERRRPASRVAAGRRHGVARLRRRLTQLGSLTGLRSSLGPRPSLDTRTVSLVTRHPSEQGFASPRSGTGTIKAPRRASSPPWPPARHLRIGATNAGRSNFTQLHLAEPVPPFGRESVGSGSQRSW